MILARHYHQVAAFRVRVRQPPAGRVALAPATRQVRRHHLHSIVIRRAAIPLVVNHPQAADQVQVVIHLKAVQAVIQRVVRPAFRVQAAAIRAGVIPAIAILKAPIANQKVIPKVNLIPTVFPSVQAFPNHPVVAKANHRATPNQVVIQTAIHSQEVIPTARAAPATLAADL